jgi:hypothetical protein
MITVVMPQGIDFGHQVYVPLDGLINEAWLEPSHPYQGSTDVVSRDTMALSSEGRSDKTETVIGKTVQDSFHHAV